MCVIPAVHAETVEIVTGRGNVFVMESSNGTGTSSDTGTSLINGFGVISRLVHQNYGGSIIHGSGLVGEEDSLKPYNHLDTDTQFAVAVTNNDSPIIMHIPEFHHQYSFNNNTLVKASSDLPNILGYADSRRLSGDIHISTYDGLKIQGTGRMILKLPDYNSQRLSLEGHLSKETTIRLVQSPHDLMTIPYDTGVGFLIHYCTCNPGPQTLNVLAGTVDDSVKSGIFEYDQKAHATGYNGKCCKGAKSYYGNTHQITSADLVVTGGSNGYLRVAGDRTTPSLINLRDILGYASLLQTYYNEAINFQHWIYDTLPVKSHQTFSGEFESISAFPHGTNYLVIDSAGDDSILRATAITERNFVDIVNLPADTGYRILRDDRTVAMGVTSNTGIITLLALDSMPSGIGGNLVLYNDSLGYVSDGFDSVIFDHANGIVLPIHHTDNKLYNIHAYVKIPISDDVEITGISLDGSLALEYLEGNYTQMDSLLVPVIPGYKRIGLEINGVPLSLDISDVVGSPLYISDSVSSDITQARPDGFTHSIDATAGTVAYLVATTNGYAKAQMQAVVSGESEIINIRKFAQIPPPPPPPQPRDPLTAWVEVYVNGKPVDVDNHSKTQIFFSDSPVTDHTAKSDGHSSMHISRFSYPEVRLFETVSIPVREADFVEFYFYATIHAEGSIPPVPSGYAEYHKSSSASAVVTIKHASINAGM